MFFFLGIVDIKGYGELILYVGGIVIKLLFNVKDIYS